MATKILTLQVVCPHCHDGESGIMLSLNDLTTATCSACDESFDPATAAAMFAEMADRWNAVAEWIRSAPIV